MSSSGRRWCSTTARAAFSASAACAPAMKAWAWARWASINRGAVSLIAPNDGDHLECDECGQCIDICPVGALTSGAYRYQTRPWEMEHVGTICTHCSNGCKTTLGVRNDEIIRGNNRDRSGINGEFLCIKGRYAFDFYNHAERLQSPHDSCERQAGAGLLVEGAAKPSRRSSARSRSRGGKFGVIGSNHTTNEENFYLQKFARAGPRHQQYRSPPHGRRGHAGRCAQRHHRRSWPPRRISTTAKRSWSSAPISRSSSRSSPSRFAPTTGITRRMSTSSPPERFAKTTIADQIDSQAAGHGTRRARRTARRARGRTGTGHRVQRHRQGRRCPQAGRVRRIRSASRSTTARWSIIRTRAARSTWASCPNCCPAIRPPDTPGMTVARDARGARPRCALGGRRESAERRPDWRRRTRSSSCRTCS